MPTVNVNICPEIINWALSQTQEDKLSDKLMNNITKWLDGTKKPTFNQIEDFSKKANIPLGYFFLQTPPVEQIDLLEYRTVDSVQLANPSRNLVDTIHEMENIQDWMKTYRQDLGFDDAWYDKSKDAREAFNYIRRQLEVCGVVVMMSGIVGKNTHRALDVDEFRAFAMVDDWAPLIFINTADSNGARLFSILHEIVHIWLGRDDLFNDRQSRISGVSDIEVICNAVAGELIVPKNAFLNKWDMYDMEIFEKITELAKYFRCGETVIARKAIDCKKIEQNIYDEVANTAIKNYKQMKENKQTDGGNYYNTMGYRLDGWQYRFINQEVRIMEHLQLYCLVLRVH